MAYTWLPAHVIRRGYEEMQWVTAARDTGVQQKEAISWAGMSQLGLDRKLSMIQSNYLINLNLLSVTKTRQTFPVGTQNDWLVSLYEATLSIPTENLAYGAAVGAAGATGLTRWLSRSLHPCKRKHPHAGEVKTCLPSRTLRNLLLWLHTSSYSGTGNSHFHCHFPISFRQFTQATRRQSQALFQKLTGTPCAAIFFMHQHRCFSGQDFTL